MHTWALFSCSSLITLTAYNLTHLPKTAKSAPEPEPDASDQLAEDTKFSLDTMSGQFPEFEQIARPPLPDQPQLARKIDEPPGYNPALYDPAQYPVREVDLVGGVLLAKLPGGMPDRVDAIAPLPTPFPPPPAVNPFPVATNPSAAAIAPRLRAVSQPRPEPAAVAPSFVSRAAPATVATVATTPSAPPSAPVAEVTATNPAPELFAALPDGIAIAPPSDVPVPLAAPPAAPEIAMTDVVSFDPLAEMTAAAGATVPANADTAFANVAAVLPAATNVNTTPVAEPLGTPVTGAAAPKVAPAPTFSMELAPARQDLIDRYCDRPLADTNASTREAVCDADTNE
ncbi:hypothetical protein [Halomicronema sp. CCY15110]|uniref:hypothetical protein n=1 Tax=Halomicronema sp. CCY15110 TaxID=2767773 RepID=UPI00194EB5C6|nr:hypothetical protein [Halomicronema sp. CCY15110]